MDRRVELFLGVLLCFVFHRGEAERVKGKIYVNIDTGNRAACFRRLNGTGQVGCTSDPKGNVGVVHYVERYSDIQWLVEEGKNEPYAVLLNAVDFNMINLNYLKASGKVNGVMVIHLEGNDTETFDKPASFSPDRTCPNNYNGLYAGDPTYGNCQQGTWNSVGQDMMFQDIGFPIFILTDKNDVQFIIDKCYKKFNKPHKTDSRWQQPMCAVELKDRMDGAKDSETCYRRSQHQTTIYAMQYCDPLGDKNVFATVKALNTSVKREDRSVIIAAARMDSFSMFENYYPSADNHVTGIVALLAAAEAIGKVKDEFQVSDKDILFTFFQGEAFDYIGSGRMVYDMLTNNFPDKDTRKLSEINLNHISHFVELNQVGNRDMGKLWIHVDPITQGKVSGQIDQMIRDLKTINPDLVDSLDQSKPLPPASVQSFLKKTKDNPFPAVVITDHKAEYTNKYFNSRFDEAQTIGVVYPEGMPSSDKYNYVTPQASQLTDVATLLAKFLYKTATGKDAPDTLMASNATVTHLLYCYLVSPSCELVKENLDFDKDDLADTPYPFYVGVSHQTNTYTHITHRLLFRFFSNIVPNRTANKETCRKTNDGLYHLLVKGPCLYPNCSARERQCLSSTANVSKALSIAFDDELGIDYDFKSREYSTWTESSWAIDAMNVRFFLVPSKRLEMVTLFVGIAILLTSLAGSWWINRQRDVLFSRRPSRRY